MVLAQPPFTGHLVHTPAFCKPEQMLSLSRAALRVVEARDDGEWFEFRDWHLHDGWINEPKVVAREVVREWHRSISSLPCDEYMVYPAIYPERMNWLWRWYIDEDDPNDCAFDFTADQKLLDEFLSKTPEPERSLLQVVPWSKVFDVRELPPSLTQSPRPPGW